MSKKTFSVADILERVNHVLESENFNQDEKRGIGIIMESILHASGNYQGFGYNKMLEDYSSVVPGTENSVCYHPSNKIRDEYAALERERKEKGGIR